MIGSATSHKLTVKWGCIYFITNLRTLLLCFSCFMTICDTSHREMATGRDREIHSAVSLGSGVTAP